MLTTDQARAMTDGELRYALRDLGEVIAVQEETNRAGHRTPKLGQYHDELFAVAGELRRRREGRA